MTFGDFELMFFINWCYSVITKTSLKYKLCNFLTRMVYFYSIRIAFNNYYHKIFVWLYFHRYFIFNMSTFFTPTCMTVLFSCKHQLYIFKHWTACWYMLKLLRWYHKLHLHLELFLSPLLYLATQLLFIYFRFSF